MGWEPRAPLPQQVSITSARSGRGQDQNTPQKWHRMLGQGDEQGLGRGEAKEEERGEEREKEGEEGAKKIWGRFRRGKRERKEKAETKQQHKMVESHLERPGRTKGQRRPTQPSLSAPFSLWSKEEVRNHLCCGERAAAIGQVSVCYLGPDLSWAWAAKQPWGQEISLRRGEGSGPCKVGGVRVCAPPLLAPKFSPDGPSATVPVLGCSFPEESYPSLANQPSSGAKQGDVRCGVREGQRPQRGSVLCLLDSLRPCGLHAQHLPWDSLACWRGPGSGHVS